MLFLEIAFICGYPLKLLVTSEMRYIGE